jgi:hypothetical protein
MAPPAGDEARPAGSSVGTVLWRNWRQYKPDRFGEAFEVSLYSDADFTGWVQRPGWPVDLIPTLTDPTSHGLQFVLVARVRWFLEPPPAAVPAETDDKSHYGGQAEDEIAALLSLALGVRCRSGGITRQWLRHSGETMPDPLGQPIEFNHRPPMWTPPLRGRPFLPELPASVSLEEAVQLLDLLPKISGTNSVALVRAARLYANALWVCDGDPNLGWLQMVSAVETAAVQRHGTKPVWKRVEQEMPDLWKALVDGGGQQHAENVGAKLADMVRSADRFARFMEEFGPGPPARRPEEHLQIDWSEIHGRLKTIYEFRSRALHSGTPFPAPMCEPPMTWGTDVQVEKPPWISSQQGASVWAAADIPMYLHTFEYLARGALLAWWRSLA